MNTEWKTIWFDATKEEPKDNSYVYVWVKNPNPKWKPKIWEFYYSNKRYWYDSAKRQHIQGAVMAWAYTDVPDFIKWEGVGK